MAAKQDETRTRLEEGVVQTQREMYPSQSSFQLPREQATVGVAA